MSDQFGVSDFGVVSRDWSVVNEIDVYRKDHRKIGGKGGWLVDVGMVNQIVASVKIGVHPLNAAQLAGLPPGLYKRWMALGERLAEKVFGHLGVELSDEEEGYLWMYRQISNADALYKSKGEIVINETISGNVKISQLQARTAVEMLAKRSPKEWERKSKVEYEDDSPEKPLGQLGGGESERIVVDNSVKDDRDKEVEARRNRGRLGGLNT